MNKLIPSLLFFCLAFHGFSQCENLTSSVVVSTGYNPSTSNVVPDLALDPMWRLVLAPADPVGWTSNIGGPAVVVPISNAWFFAGSTSKYINAYPTNAALTDNWNLTTIPYVFERKFCVCDPSSTGSFQDVTFDLGLNADNWAEVEIEDPQGNVTLLGAQPYVYSTANFDANPTTINVTLQLAPGEHKMRIIHRNKLVDMGVNLNGTISSTGLVSDDGCVQNGSIAGFLFHDVNGNQIKDDGDVALHGRFIELYDEAQSLISTAETDHAGYYFFMDLSPGDYTLKAVSETDWGFTPATLPLQNIEVSINEVTTVDYLVWAEPTAIDESPETSFVNVFPNPAERSFNVVFSNESSQNHALSLTDHTGAIVLRQQVSGNTAVINTEDVASGVYVLRIAGEDGERIQKMVIK